MTFFTTEPTWYWALLALTILAAVAIARHVLRGIRRARRRESIRSESNQRFIEDLLWDIHRQEAFELALRLRADRLDGEPLHDLLRADVIA